MPAVFDPARNEYAAARAELRGLLSPAEFNAARRSTLNAHYTDAGIVGAVWSAVTRLGFTGGDVLEPGCGSGNFIGLAPPDARMVGVEVEPVTAAIAAALYPQAQVRAESFADTRAPEGSFDLVIGNVPFGSQALADRRHNPGGHSIHNHFLIKSLHLTRPGGLVVALTSRYTLDSRNPAARREMAQLADLVGAVRLPSRAHQQAAGTSVVTDLLVLRRREPGRPGNGESWENVTHADLPLAPARRADRAALPGDEAPTPTGTPEPVEINRYLLEHPEQMLGTAMIGRGAYRANELLVEPTGPLEQALAAGLDRVVAHADAHDLRHTSSADTPPGRRVALAQAGVAHREGFITTAEDGGFTRIRSGSVVEHPVPQSQAGELRALLGLRDTVVALLEAEAATIDDTVRIAELRDQLGHRYQTYTDRYGPVQRCTWRRTGRVDPDTGQERMARIRPGQGGFRVDPFSPIVRALEHYDDATGTATKSAIFTQRVVAPRAPRLGADNPADALAICVDTFGEVRLTEIARLLGTDTDTARAGLGTLVFDQPPTSSPESGQLVAGPARLVVASEYLSGNVRAKLAAATDAAAADPTLAPNVAALREVIPADLGPSEIHARLGAPWIDAPDVQQFLRATLDDPGLRVEHPGGSIWAVKGAGVGVAATSTWGTTRRAAPDLAQAALEQRAVKVYDEFDDGSRVLNLTETIAAQEKMRALDERFGEWVWEDPARAERLARVYNDTFNNTALRSYDNVALSLPGVALTFTPRPHQVAAVARMIAEPAVGLFHEVGAGKTAEMVMGTMELRRLGLVRKPAIVVPNHMLEQFATEFLAIYPRANILPAGRDDLAGDKRRDFVARAATGDWDAIILTRSAFEKLPMSPQRQTAYQERESQRLREWIEKARAQTDSSLTIKRMEATLARAEERLKNKLGADKDPGLSFETTGIDWVAIDEAHDYKNLRTVSNIPDAQVEGSQRASDLDMKLDYLRERYGGRVGVLATATPIANSITEAYTMLRYLRPDLLDAAGIEDFDTWAAAFGEVVTGIELSPDGARPRMKSRFARFKNVPELLRMWHVCADVKTAEDLQLPVPQLSMRSDGKRGPQIVVVPPSPELQDLVADLGRRADAIRVRAVKPEQDNMLKIAGDGRAAALDLRLVGEHTTETTKLDVAADRIAATWRAHREDRFPGPGGDEHPVPGGLQLVFSDLGTPNPERWNVYQQLRTQLHERGMPVGSVRFMHEARNDVEKAAMFQAARSGQIAVLIGSTQRMGVGTNVQARAVALHHLDCPWRPADIAQREGRIIRWGNHNPEVDILRYVTEGSFDAYSWQTVTRKAGFIAQIMRGRLDVREIEDIGDVALSFDEVKALATGDPRILDKAKADADLTRLERLERAHHRNRDHLVRSARDADRTVAELSTELATVQAAIGRRTDTRGEAFRAVLGTQPHTNRADAGRALQAMLLPPLDRLDRYSRPTDTRVIGQLGGHQITAALHPAGDDILAQLTLPGVPRATMTLEREQLRDADPAGLIMRIENRLTGLDRLAEQLGTDITAATRQGEKARAEQDQPFAQAAQLADARARSAELAREMTQAAIAADQPADTPPPQPATTTEPTTTEPTTTEPITAAPTAAENSATTSLAQVADAPTAGVGSGAAAGPAPAGLDHAAAVPIADTAAVQSTGAATTAAAGARTDPGSDGLTAAVTAWRRRRAADQDEFGVAGAEHRSGLGPAQDEPVARRSTGHGLR